MRDSKKYNWIRLLPVLFVAMILSVAVACNKKDDDTDDSDSYLSAESVAITNFSLQADARVMKNLDSVFFSIDLEHGVVYNADSLPKGTNITKLVPVISYPKSVASATIEMKGGTHREDGTVNYMTNPSDTIDFTGEVTLTLATSGNTVEKTYRLKVNVHQEDPDTIYWDKLADMALPSRLSSPKAQKTVTFDTGVLSIIQESDGTYTTSFTADIFEGGWQKNAVSFSFTPDLASLTSSDDATLYMRSADGGLYSSTDGIEWSQLDSGWDAVIGIYGTSLLGRRSENGKEMMVSWPSGSLPGVELPAGFPTSGYSNALEYTNRWTPYPTIMIIGGAPFSSTGTAAWAFDGDTWVNIADRPMPPLSNMTVIDYYSYLKSASNGLLKEFNVWIALGGNAPDGSINRTVYISYDYGVNWQTAPEYMQLPEGIDIGTSADAITLGTSMQSNLSSRWSVAPRRLPRRLPYVVDDDIVKWECPYIFVFGGKNRAGILNDRVRSAVLQRLTFTPLF